MINIYLSLVRVLHITVKIELRWGCGAFWICVARCKMGRRREWDILLKLRCRVEVITVLQFLTVNSLEILNSVHRRHLLLYIHCLPFLPPLLPGWSWQKMIRWYTWDISLISWKSKILLKVIITSNIISRDHSKFHILV